MIDKEKIFHKKSIPTGINTPCSGKNRVAIFSAIVAVFILIMGITPLFSQVIPKVTLSVADAQKPTDVALALQILFLITILAVAPSLLVLLTSFVRLIIVFSFL